MNKTEAAFRMSAEKLFAESPKVYFWTFTFTEVWDDWVYARQWTRFWNDFCNHSNFFIGGLKVVELHREHGLHYHCLLNARLPVSEIRRIGRKYGVGRVHVVRAKPSAMSYLSKYLSKKDSGLSKSIRKWSTVGHFEGVKVTNVQVDSDFVRRLAHVKGPRRLTFTGYQMARREYVLTGRVSPTVVFNHLHKPDLAQFERMLAADILRRVETERANDFEEDADYDDERLLRFYCEEDKSIRRVVIYRIIGTCEADERRGKIEGYVSSVKQGLLMTEYLNNKLKENCYAS